MTALVGSSILARSLVPCLVAEPVGERRFVTNSRLGLGSENNISASLRIGDLDGDRDLDVVVANGRHWPQQNFIFFNQGRARFNLTRRLGHDTATSYATERADLDHDADLAIAFCN